MGIYCIVLYCIVLQLNKGGDVGREVTLAVAFTATCGAVLTVSKQSIYIIKFEKNSLYLRISILIDSFSNNRFNQFPILFTPDLLDYPSALYIEIECLTATTSMITMATATITASTTTQTTSRPRCSPRCTSRSTLMKSRRSTSRAEMPARPLSRRRGRRD